MKIFNCGIRWVLQGGRIQALPFSPGCLSPAWCRAAQVPTLLEGPRREDGPRDMSLAMVHTAAAPAAAQVATPHLLLALRKEE